MLNPIETIIRNSGAIHEALRNLCDKGEFLLLVTPYIRYESNFLRLEQEAVHVSALMGLEDARFGLKSPDLRMRFPYGHQFFEAPTRLLGVGHTGGRQSVALAYPTVMTMDDHRAAYRVERVGRLMATFSSRHFELLMASVVNLSTTGVRIFALRDLEAGEVQVEDLIHISLTVTPEIQINCKAKVRYVKDRLLGLEFRPSPDGRLLENLARWAFQKQEEERLLRADRKAPGPLGPEGSEGSFLAPQSPVLALVSSSEDLETRLRDMLKDLPPLERLSPSTQTMKDLAAKRNVLVIYHAGSLSPEERKRMRILLDSLGGRTPFVLLGTDVDSGALFELGNEVRAVSSFSLGTTATAFFPRLLQGILRKHFPV